MKPLIPKSIVALAIFAMCYQALAATTPRGLIIYTEPPQTYVETLEFVSITTTSIAFATAVLPNGPKQEISRGGIIAIINYPPSTPTEYLPQEAAAALRSIQTLRPKYPQFAAKLNAVETRWNNSLEVYRQSQRLAKATPSPSTKSLKLEVDGVAYEQAVMTSFDGATVGISHAAGVARIPAIKLKTEQIAALNSTSTSVHIDPHKIAAIPPPATSADSPANTGPNPTKTVQPSVLAEPSHPPTDSVGIGMTPDELAAVGVGPGKIVTGTKATLSGETENLVAILRENGYEQGTTKLYHAEAGHTPNYQFRNDRLDTEVALFGSPELKEMKIGIQLGRRGKESTGEALAHLRDLSSFVAPESGAWLVGRIRQIASESPNLAEESGVAAEVYGAVQAHAMAQIGRETGDASLGDITTESVLDIRTHEMNSPMMRTAMAIAAHLQTMDPATMDKVSLRNGTSLRALGRALREAINNNDFDAIQRSMNAFNSVMANPFFRMEDIEVESRGPLSERQIANANRFAKFSQLQGGIGFEMRKRMATNIASKMNPAALKAMGSVEGLYRFLGSVSSMGDVDPVHIKDKLRANKNLTEDQRLLAASQISTYYEQELEGKNNNFYGFADEREIQIRVFAASDLAIERANKMLNAIRPKPGNASQAFGDQEVTLEITPAELENAVSGISVHISRKVGAEK